MLEMSRIDVQDKTIVLYPHHPTTNTTVATARNVCDLDQRLGSFPFHFPHQVSLVMRCP